MYICLVTSCSWAGAHGAGRPSPGARAAMLPGDIGGGGGGGGRAGAEVTAAQEPDCELGLAHREPAEAAAPSSDRAGETSARGCAVVGSQRAGAVWRARRGNMPRAC